MAEIITIVIAVTLGYTFGVFWCHPTKQFEEGWNRAKAFFTDWEDGFRTGVEHASKVFQDYDQGFGDGFECGFNAALDSKNAEVKTEGQG